MKRVRNKPEEDPGIEPVAIGGKKALTSFLAIILVTILLILIIRFVFL